MAEFVITTASLSAVGRVPQQNDDAVHAWSAPGRPTRLGVRAALVVADGVGGGHAGERASGLAVDRVRQALHRTDVDGEFASSGQVQAYLQSIYAWINTQIRDLGGSPEPCATLTSVVVVGDQFALAHVGSTRAYLVRDGEIRQLTADSADGPALGQAEAAEVQVAAGVLQTGDRLLVCSDGLNAHLDDGEIAEVLLRVDEPADACQELVALALRRGGTDNVSVAVARCAVAAEQAPAATPPVAASAPAAHSAISLNLGQLLRQQKVVVGGVLLLCLFCGVLVGRFRTPKDPAPPPPAGSPANPAGGGATPLPGAVGAPGAAVPAAPSAAVPVGFSADGKKLLIVTNAAGRVEITPPLSGAYSPKHDKVDTWSIEMRSAASGQLDKITLDRVEDRVQVALTGTGAMRTADLGPGNYVLKVSDIVVGQIAVKP